MRKEAEIDISTARELKGLGTIDVRHDEYDAVYKVLVRHMVGHSRPTLVGSLTHFFLFHVSLLFCNTRPFKPRGIVALHLFGECISSFVPTRSFLVFVSGSVSGYRVIG